MQDSELERIRQARLAELRKAQGDGKYAGSGSQAGSPSGPGGANQADAQARAEEMRASILSQICTPQARERLSRIEMVRPERARQVEQIIIRMGQSGQLNHKIEEEELVQLLNKIPTGQEQSKIVINRRDHVGSDDSDNERELDSYNSNRAGKASAEDSDDDFFD